MKSKVLFNLVILAILGTPITSPAGYVEMPAPDQPPPNVYVQPGFPALEVIPDTPVYYAPNMHMNLFFYDGIYWSFFDENWYMSSWYSGPWYPVDPINVPFYLLNIPVRYYVNPPSFFHSWGPDERPHWDERWRDAWGDRWEQKNREFRQWRPSPNMTPAPLPSYQQKFNGTNYPQRLEDQHNLHQNNYNYQPKEPVVQQHFSQPPTIQPVKSPPPPQAPKSTGNQINHSQHPENGEHPKP